MTRETPAAEGVAGFSAKGANVFANEHVRIETTVAMNFDSWDWFSNQSPPLSHLEETGESSVEGHFPHAHAERPILAIWLRREIKIDRADSTDTFRIP